MGDSVESLAEVKVDNIHGSPLIYPAGHAIAESYQIGQAWFPLGESMLTTPDNLLFLHYIISYIIIINKNQGKQESGDNNGWEAFSYPNAQVVKMFKWMKSEHLKP